LDPAWEQGRSSLQPIPRVPRVRDYEFSKQIPETGVESAKLG
jgi:hypothetical protein